MDLAEDQPVQEIHTRDRCALHLRHFPGPTAQKPVLLVHGASAGSDTFRIGEEEALITHLVAKGFDVWTLDWRASKHRAKELYCKVVREDPLTNQDLFTIGRAAQHDVPRALEVLKDTYGPTKIGLVGHCLGGGIVAEGIARGWITADRVDRVVLSALGLFYRAAIDNVLKAEDRILEQLFLQGQTLLHPDPAAWSDDVCGGARGKAEWSPLLERPFEVWLGTGLKHACRSGFCARLCYLFGMPYRPEKIPTIHERLEDQFGFIPMQFLLHCTENLRRGHAAAFGAGADDTTALDPEPFRRLRRLTLMTGEINSLWHRDSIDLMFEWLARGRGQRQVGAWLHKAVLPGYSHQDLLWGVGAPAEVFPTIVAGLEPSAPPP